MRAVHPRQEGYQTTRIIQISLPVLVIIKAFQQGELCYISILYRPCTLYLPILGTPLPPYPFSPNTHQSLVLSQFTWWLQVCSMCLLHSKIWTEGAACQKCAILGGWREKRKTLGKATGGHLKRLGASRMSLLLILLGPKEVTWPNLMSVRVGSRPLPERYFTAHSHRP